MQSESDSVRDECSSSGLRSEPEDELPPHVGASSSSGGGRSGGAGNPLSAVSWEQRGSTSTLSSCSTTSQQQAAVARLVQSSSVTAGRDNSLSQPPPPPPRTSSAMGVSGSSGNNISSGSAERQQQQQHQSSDLGKSKATCMQCYLSGHSDGSVESVEPTSSTATEDASSCGGTPKDRDSGLGPETETGALAAVAPRGDAQSPPVAPAAVTSPLNLAENAAATSQTTIDNE